MKIEYVKGEVRIAIPCGPDVIKSAPHTGTGKSKRLASTNGFIQVQGAPDGVRISLNLIAKKE